MIMLLTALAALACEAVVDVTVHTPDGPHAGWDVVWQGGAITAVGPKVAPAGCTTHTVPGGQVTAGFVAMPTHLGLIDVELEGGTHDDTWGGDPVRAAFRVADAYNPRSVMMPVTRLGGITTALTAPSGGLISGQSAAVRLVNGDQADTVLRSGVGMHVNLGALGSSAAGLLRLRELLAEARFLQKQTQPFLVADALSASRLDLQALAEVAAGKQPLFVTADRASDIEAVLRFAREEAVRVVIFGGAEGWLVAEQLASAKVPVVLNPLVYGAGSFDQTFGRPDNAALLDAAGVTVVIDPASTPNARALRFVAGNAVRGGLPHAAALRAITSAPAAVLGLTDRGAVRVGARADLALWTGDPLDTPGRLAGLWIDGDAQPLRSRQTELVDAWRELPR